MIDRSFSEIDLREMLQHASQFRPDPSARFVIRTMHSGQPWEIVVEPDAQTKVLVVVTAFPVG